MKVFICLSVVLALVASCMGKNEPKVVCYYTNWARYRTGRAQYTPKDIDPRLCTHILYSFATVNADHTIAVHDPWADLGDPESYSGFGGYGKVLATKRQNSDLKVLLAVGGWNEGGYDFSAMASSLESRKIFIDSAVKVLEEWGFDGIDLDWEYPVIPGVHPGKPEDRDNFSFLIQDLQKEFHYRASRSRPKMLVTAAVTPAVGKSDRAYDRYAICSDLDFVNLMTYDIHGGWDAGSYGTGYHAALYPPTDDHTDVLLSIDNMINDWLYVGCDSQKLILGIPLYGRSYALRNQHDSKVKSPSSGKGMQGPFTAAMGTLSYYEICDKINNGWKEVYDESAVAVYAYGDGQWVSYDNPKSIAVKIDYLKRKNLGGAMVWALDFDDFNGQSCGQGDYPLMHAINKGLGSALKTKPITTIAPHTQPTTTTPKAKTSSKPYRRRNSQRRNSRRRRRRTTKRPRSTKRPTTVQPTTSPPTNPLPGNAPCASYNIERCSGEDAKKYKDWCTMEKYLWCVKGFRVPFHMSCPATTKFNPSTQGCEI